MYLIISMYNIFLFYIYCIEMVNKGATLLKCNVLNILI